MQWENTAQSRLLTMLPFPFEADHLKYTAQASRHTVLKVQLLVQLIEKAEMLPRC